MEIANRFINLHRWVTHGGFPYQTLLDIEWYTEILCARANIHLVCPHGTMPLLGMCPSWPEVCRRILFFRDAYFPPHAPDVLALQPKHPGTPSDEQRSLWGLFVSCFPASDEQYAHYLRKHADNILHGVQSRILAADLFQFSSAHLAHSFPDERAVHLFQGHFVLFVEFCLEQHEGKLEGLIQATVHGSERTNKLHWPTLRIPLTPNPLEFRPSLHRCTCESGYVLGCFQRAADRHHSQGGVCSHLQALLMALMRVRQRSLETVWYWHIASALLTRIVLVQLPLESQRADHRDALVHRHRCTWISDRVGALPQVPQPRGSTLDWHPTTQC